MSNELELKAIAHLSLLLHASTAIDRQEESLFKSFDNACVIRRQTALQSTPASANRYKEAIWYDLTIYGISSEIRCIGQLLMESQRVSPSTIRQYGWVMDKQKRVQVWKDGMVMDSVWVWSAKMRHLASCNQTINNRTIDHTSNYVEQFTAADRQEATLLESFETACRAHRKEVATTWTIIDPDSEFHWYQYSAADTARQKRQVDSFSLPMQRFFKIPMNLMKGEGWTARFVKWKNDMFRMGMRVWVGKMGRGDDVGWVG
ncbi:MAG: hypothetical protein Q9162_001326 [Coniocarpon cinnabarinum]